MRLNCIAGQHDASPGEVRNQGFAFSRCRCCGCDMVRSNSEWRRVPRGFRVVWRRRRPRQDMVSAAQLLFDLSPATGRSLIVPPPGRGRLAAMFIRIMARLRSLGGAAGGRLRGWGVPLPPPAVLSPLEPVPHGPECRDAGMPTP